MTTVTGLTAARMEEIEAASVVDGNVVDGDLILVRHDGVPINAGSVMGPVGPSGSGYTICTSTTRPSGLDTSHEGLAIYETDTNLRRYWTGTVWKTQERVHCTSATRPTGLLTVDEGLVIYETDTGNEYFWTGTAWQDYPTSFCAVYGASPGNISIPGSTETTLLSLTVPEQPRACLLVASAQWCGSWNVSNDKFIWRMKVNGTERGACVWLATDTTLIITASIAATVPHSVPANTEATVIMTGQRITGSGNCVVDGSAPGRITAALYG